MYSNGMIWIHHLISYVKWSSNLGVILREENDTNILDMHKSKLTAYKKIFNAWKLMQHRKIWLSVNSKSTAKNNKQ